MARVIVVIATYQRPERLAVAVSRLQQSAARLPEGWSAGVVLVDDDPAGSAEPVAERFRDAFALGCGYVRSGSRNISVARNTGLEAVLDHADWAGSIDDDVEVPDDWFNVCRRALESGPYDAVTGPLLKDFSAGPAWLSTEPFRYFGLLLGEEGRPSEFCATGNNWLSTAFLREHGLRFDPELGRTGGEDMDFFYRATDLGLRPVYSLAAGVREPEPPARCTLRYQVRRAYWLGISESQISLRRGKATRARLAARALRRAVNRGARTLPPDVRRSRGWRYTLALWAQCLGVWLGCTGARLQHR